MRNHVFAYDKSMMIIQSSQCMMAESVLLLEATKTHKRRATLVAGAMAASMIGGVGVANAALVSVCAGVSLPKSVVTDIVGQAVLPITGILDGVPLLGLLGLNTNLTNTLSGIAAGGPINLNVLDTDGNAVASNAPCQTTSDSYTLNTPKGISIGGNQITGLGNGITADAGEMNSIAFGNGASTNALATNSIAIGPNASIGALGVNSMAIGSGTSVNVANSVALGAGSTATTGAESNYTAYGLTATQTSVGEVSVGSSGNTRKITNVAAGSVANDAVNVAQLQAVDDGAVKYDPLSLKMTVTLGGPLSADGGTTGGTRVTNLAKGAVNATSTDAINGSQLFGITSGMTANMDALGLSMATNLGGGAIYNSTTGAVSAPTYNVYGASQNNVGSAITALQVNAPLQYSNSAGVATPNTPSNDVTLVGSALGPVTIHNVANGVVANDAVNMSQLDAMQNNVSNLDALAVKYDAATKDTITLAGPLSADGGTTGGTRVTNLAKGAVNATSTDAINGSQLFGITSGVTAVTANMDALGLSMATNLGGGATYNSTTGAVSAPTYNVYGTDQHNVGDAITALQTIAPLQYSDAAGHVTPNIPSNDVTLVGSNVLSPVTLHNVANGVAPHDAVNMSQLDAVQNNVSDLDALAVKYDGASKDTITLAGLTDGTTITNLHQGLLSAISTDAVNGSQLYATNQAIDATNQTIANMSSGGGIKYFHANSTQTDSAATGVDSVAIGSRSTASGDGSVAMGDNSKATDTGAIAIGQNSVSSKTGAIAIGQDSISSGVNSIAIGTGAVARGSVAVGVGAQAGNGGAAFGDNAIALTPLQGTAVGNAATVTANRGVAIGAGSQAVRAGMNGATEKYSNVSVTSTEGAVSVGSLGKERQITNVAGGTADTDAVNVRQLDAAVAQSSIDANNRINSLQSDISSVKYDSNAGTASAMAMASMPQSVIPGKVMVAAGVANYQGQSAMAIGVSNFSENGRWMVNFNGTANTRGNAGAAVGVGFHW
jgi:autotransporter adhesin